MRKYYGLILLAFLFILCCSCSQQTSKHIENKKPNVILVITDDQGYGDLGAHGNPYIKTPHLDSFYAECVRFTDFHVSPTCTPSRAALMTGRHTNRTGAWHTIAGWSMLREEEKTMANMFEEGGYRTGAFGKWHLGDNYPYRVIDRGFQESVVHGGGGVQQTPDYWGNDYFDDTYFHNGNPQKYEGYCTDVFFEEAMGFIEERKDKPFFCYISTNAPHWPYNVPPEYEAMYDEYSDSILLTHQKQFLGMITNIDENFGKLRNKLVELNIEDNTILIFMADNGTAAGYAQQDRNDPKSPYLGYNANMRGTKNSQYEGGHRVPFFIYWKDGNVHGGKDIHQLTAHIDVVPSLAELCGLPLAEGYRSIDGSSLKPLLYDENIDWGNRVLVTDSQREQVPVKWRKTAVMKNKWRLVNVKELYNVKDDPTQSKDISADHQDVVKDLTIAYDDWWESVSVDFEEEMYIKVGTEYENPTVLTTHDWHADNGNPKWNQLVIRNGKYGNGYWTIDVVEKGTYAIKLRRYPLESGLKFSDEAEGYTSAVQPGLNSAVPKGKAHSIKTAEVRIFDKLLESKVVDSDAEEIVFTTDLATGRTKFWTYLEDHSGEVTGAYYAYIYKI